MYADFSLQKHLTLCSGNIFVPHTATGLWNVFSTNVSQNDPFFHVGPEELLSVRALLALPDPLRIVLEVSAFKVLGRAGSVDKLTGPLFILLLNCQRLTLDECTVGLASIKELNESLIHS